MRLLAPASGEGSSSMSDYIMLEYGCKLMWQCYLFKCSVCFLFFGFSTKNKPKLLKGLKRKEKEKTTQTMSAWVKEVWIEGTGTTMGVVPSYHTLINMCLWNLRSLSVLS